MEDKVGKAKAYLKDDHEYWFTSFLKKRGFKEESKDSDTWWFTSPKNSEWYYQIWDAGPANEDDWREHHRSIIITLFDHGEDTTLFNGSVREDHLEALFEMLDIS